MGKNNLRNDADLIRRTHLKRDWPRSNVAVAELYLAQGICLGMAATSKRKSPAPKPQPLSQGGQFEPSVDPYSQRLMDTDAEYKLLSAIAEVLETYYHRNIEGRLDLYTERKPCQSCEKVLAQFRQKFPKIEVRLDWSHPYPP